MIQNKVNSFIMKTGFRYTIKESNTETSVYFILSNLHTDVNVHKQSNYF